MSEFEKYRATLTTVNLLMSANCCRHAFDYQQSEIDQLKAQLIDQGQRFNEQSQKVKDLEHKLKQSESKSLMAMIHGTCECGTAWSPIVSDKDGFALLHCFNCKNDRYENIEVFGDYGPKALRGEHE